MDGVLDGRRLVERDLRRMCRYLPLSEAKTIATALVTSRLAYSNSLFRNIVFMDITKLQRIQNCLVRVVTKYLRFSYFMPLLEYLHWLPVRYLVIVKMCTTHVPVSIDHMYIHCLLLFSFDHLVLIYFSVPKFKY